MDPSERAARQRHDVPPASIDCIDCIDSIEAPSPGSSVSAPNLVLEHDVRRRLLRRARRRRHAAAPSLVARRRSLQARVLDDLLLSPSSPPRCPQVSGRAGPSFTRILHRRPCSALCLCSLRSPLSLPSSLSLCAASLSLFARPLFACSLSLSLSLSLSVLLEHTASRSILQMESTSTSTSEAPSDAAVDYYELLEVDRSASTDDIRKSYGSRAGH